ncbi:MAG: FadR/GntR family transcriptional regulator [Steroidobacteraceae bacterium]
MRKKTPRQPKRRISVQSTSPKGLAQLHGSIIRDLGVSIIGGEYAVGAVLPNEEAYSERLKVSRPAFREAVRYLAGKGLVESRRKRGTVVLARENWNLLDPDVLGWFFEATPSTQFIQNLLELRLIIEPAAAELAARRRLPNDIVKLRESLEAMRVAPFASPEGMLAGSNFHRGILEATHNEVLLSMSSSIDAAMQWTLSYLQEHQSGLPDAFALHAQLLAAIERQDTAAAGELMRTMVRTSQENATRAASTAADHTLQLKSKTVKSHKAVARG